MKAKLTHITLIVVFGLFFYMNSFDNFFVWNDWTLIIENFLIRDWRNLYEIFTGAFWKPLVGEPSPIYRPLVSLSFMADFALWHLDPWGYHLTNITLHIFNSLLAYFLMSYYVSPITAFMGSVLFTTHPIHTEAVTYIYGRTELLMSFFLLGGTLLFLESKKRNSAPFYLLSLPLFFLSLLAKETAVIFPLWLVALDLTSPPSSAKKSWHWLARQAGPWATVALYFLVRKSFVAMSPAHYALDPPELIEHLILVLKAVPLYLGLLLFPIKSHFIHALSSDRLGALFFLSILLLAGAGMAVRLTFGTGRRAMAFAVLWVLIGLLPLAHFAALRLPMLEGWLYLPSLGFFLMVALMLDGLLGWTRSRMHLWLTLLIAVLVGGVTINRNETWTDELHISLDTSAASPEDPGALRLAADARFRSGRPEVAESILDKAIRIAPNDPLLQESLGRLYSFLGKEAESLALYQRAAELNREHPYPYWRLGRYHLRRSHLPEAEENFAEAVRLFPHSSRLRNDLAYVLFLEGKLDAARAELDAALQILPYSPVLRANRARLFGKPSMSSSRVLSQ